MRLCLYCFSCTRDVQALRLDDGSSNASCNGSRRLCPVLRIGKKSARVFESWSAARHSQSVQRPQQDCEERQRAALVGSPKPNRHHIQQRSDPETDLHTSHPKRCVDAETHPPWQCGEAAAVGPDGRGGSQRGCRQHAVVELYGGDVLEEIAPVRPQLAPSPGRVCHLVFIFI